MIPERFEDRGENFGPLSLQQLAYERRAQELVGQARGLLLEAGDYTANPDVRDQLENAVADLPDLTAWDEWLEEERG